MDDENSILSGTRLENLPERAMSWLSHAATCLWLYASQNGICVDITVARWRGGSLELDVKTNGTPEHVAALRRIAETATCATRLCPADDTRISQFLIERLRVHAAFLSAYLDPEIGDQAGAVLHRTALDFTAFDDHAKRVRVVSAWGTLGGFGKIVLGLRLHGGEATREKVAEIVCNADKIAKAGALPGVAWREVSEP